MNAIAGTPLDLIGTPYVQGGSSPSSGFDCWGLIEFVRREYFALDSPLIEDYHRVGAQALHTIQAEQRSERWARVEPPGTPGDVVGMAFPGQLFLHHVGVTLGARGVLHAWAGVLSGSRGSVTLTPWARMSERFKVVEVYSWRG
jgi:cell wall-associated NlpC family hydrolase